MLYDRIIPPASISRFIDCYWIVEDDESEISQQKIIPDGFPEMVFHYGDTYQINISGKWEIQSKMLLAGQIRNYFLLENTATSGIIGIKFKPAAVAQLFGVDMSIVSDKVVDLSSDLKDEFSLISDQLLSTISYQQKVELLNTFFSQIDFKEIENDRYIDEALSLIFETNGLISVSELTKKLQLNERKLERLFKTYIGLSPKFYSRIIRFNYIFKLVEGKEMNWSEIAQLSGFYDQSHFINNFQEFTGEDPSKYFFEDESLANFLLKRPVEN
tara:strand:+ start:36144 stop:36959 length:816 start_codon:yes stop_codon:yes gene_type:complete